jgi:hypothetical protein
MTGGVTLAAIAAMLRLPRRLPDARVRGDEVSQAAVTLPLAAEREQLQSRRSVHATAQAGPI